MIILLNGAFGVGKTTTAQLLVAALPNALLFDPEEVGSMVRRITAGVRAGAEDTDDFQDIALWRGLTVLTAEGLRRRYGRTLVVPMTLAFPPYCREITAGFKQFAPDLQHFCLTASLATIQERLRRRGDGPDSWPWRQAARCVEAFQAVEFAARIDTEGREPADVTGEILRRLAEDEAKGRRYQATNGPLKKA